MDAAWAKRLEEYVTLINEALEAAIDWPVNVDLGADFNDRKRLFEMLAEAGYSARMSDLCVLELSDPGEPDFDIETGDVPEEEPF